MTLSNAWMRHAKCGSYPSDLWFPEKHASAARAKAICATCPVKDQCLEYAIEHEEKGGIWGGASERERERLRRQLLRNGALRRQCVECGQWYIPAVGTQRICSDACRAAAKARQQAAFEERNRERRLAERRSLRQVASA